MRITILTPLLLLIFITQVLAQSAPPCEAIIESSIPIAAMDTICIGQNIDLTDQSTTPTGVGNIEWWLNGNFFSSATGISLTPSTEGIYMFEMIIEDSQGACDPDTAEYTVVVLGNPNAGVSTTHVSCNGLCDGEATVTYDSQNALAYSAIWGTSEVGTATDLCAGAYVAIITDSRGCTQNNYSVQTLVDEPDPLVAQIVNGQFLDFCPGDNPITLDLIVIGGTQGSPEPYTYQWSQTGGLSAIDIEDPTYTPTFGSLDQNYDVTVTDDNGCEAFASIHIATSVSTVDGTVTVGGSHCSDCEVIFMKYDPSPGVWERSEVVVTNAAGQYDFPSVTSFTDFVLMVDPGDDTYPNAVQAYYAGTNLSSHVWDNAIELNSGCAITLSKDVAIPAPTVFGGECTFRGTLYYDPTGKTQTDEDPIPLIDVVVEKTPPGNSQGKVTTDINGMFEFEFMPVSDTMYTLYVNLPGVPMSSTYEIVVDPGDTLYKNLDFCLNIDSTEISTCIVSGIEEGDEPITNTEVLVYPNPANGQFFIKTGSFEGMDVVFQIFDSAGRFIVNREFEVAPSQLEIEALSAGYYLVRMQSEDKIVATRLSSINH